MKKVLIVDDAAFARSIQKQIIASVGYEVTEAGNGAEALEVFKTEKPDLVTLDLLMPDMDGMDVLKSILEEDPDAKAIICSTDKQKFRQEEAKETGALGFVAKPVDPEKLLEMIKNILDDS
ncbi:response regulator [Desulfonema magnum]|uniref:Two component system response regulator n=1 Tax=Desulfonema magnum TaxID=45655 RepID=A0A975BMR7_9BACT|nr:response regulator [Desulfonema magnum]QTA88038.1 Two component system response regulator [Desulfonema magnum]